MSLARQKMGGVAKGGGRAQGLGSIYYRPIPRTSTCNLRFVVVDLMHFAGTFENLLVYKCMSCICQ